MLISCELLVCFHVLPLPKSHGDHSQMPRFGRAFWPSPVGQNHAPAKMKNPRKCPGNQFYPAFTGPHSNTPGTMHTLLGQYPYFS